MDILHTEANRGKKSIIYDGHTYRQVNILKNGNISYRCTNKSCKTTVSTDGNGRTIVRTIVLGSIKPMTHISMYMLHTTQLTRLSKNNNDILWCLQFDCGRIPCLCICICHIKQLYSHLLIYVVLYIICFYDTYFILHLSLRVSVM
jgi:hypothetical protein